MTLANTRSVLVDDLDPTGSIQYTGGPWFEDTDATDSPGIYGHSLLARCMGLTAAQPSHLHSMVF